MNTAQMEYKFGAGRYWQEAGATGRVGSEAGRLGKRAYVIGGPTALSLTREGLSKGFGSFPWVEEVYGGPASVGKCGSLQRAVRENGCNVLVGVGGGRVMDLAKAAARGLDIPVITVPTSAATCAAYTPLSLFYFEDGPYDHCEWHDKEVDAVLADTDILAGQPPRLLAAGILDAMAKFVEIPNGRSEMSLNNTPIDLHSAYSLARYTYDVLRERGPQAVRDLREERHTRTVDDVVFTNIALTGIVSGITKGKSQTAIAHALYDTARRKFYAKSRGSLHGELVAVGMLAQLAYNGQTERIPALMAFMRGLAMPCSLPEIGIEPSEENLEILFQAMRQGRFMVQDEEHFARLRDALNVLKEGD